MKYNILIVDDEEIAIRGIEKGVHWDALDINYLFKTHNVTTAKRIMQDYEVHILLTGIELARESGIELLRWVRANIPDVICIFFTCHAEFEYAQEAIRLGVKDYLLKPIPYGKLENIIRNSIESLNEQRQRNEKYAIIDNFAAEQNEKKAADAVTMIKKYILENLDSELRREDLAQMVNFSTSYLSKIFKEQEGTSLTDYILEQRIKMARHLLKITELSITEIAVRVGFSYHSYFTKHFKRATGVTPQQYREQIRMKSPAENPSMTDH